MGPEAIQITYIELFYDLIFAAVLSSFAFNIAFGWPGGKWLNFVQMIMLLAIWHDNVIFTNTVFSRDGLSYVLLFLQLIGVLGMAFFRNVVINGGGDTLLGFVVAFLWARFFTIVLYLCVVFSKSSSPSTKGFAAAYALLIALTCIPAAATLGIAGTVDVYGRVMIWLIGAGINHVAAFALPLLPAFASALPVVDRAHFRDRFGALLVFLFGYMLTATFFDESGPYTSGEWGSIVLIWLITFAFVWMYYGDRNDDNRHGVEHPLLRMPTVIGQLWQFLHLPLAMAVVIMADAAVQIIYFYRGILRLPNTVVTIPNSGPPLELRLSNTVQWIYGVSFAIALALIIVIGLLYKYETRQHSKRRMERSILRAMLVVVMVLVPLGGLNSPMEPIIQLIVGAVVLFVLVVFDWVSHVALGPADPASTAVRTVAVLVPVAGVSSEVLDAKDREIAELRTLLALAAQAAPRDEGIAGVGGESEEMSSSKDWGFSSRTSSVVEDVVISDDATDEFEEDAGQSPMSNNTSGTHVGTIDMENNNMSPTQSGSEQPVPDDQSSEADTE